MSANATTARKGYDSKARTSPQSRVPVNVVALDRECIRRGWTRGELAARMGVNPVTIWALYRDASTSPATFAKLTAALEANPPSEMASRLMGETA